jgi:hypothetical protein
MAAFCIFNIQLFCGIADHFVDPEVGGLAAVTVPLADIRMLLQLE